MNIPKVLLCALTLLAVLGGPALAGEKEVLAFFQEQGARITLNKTGQATKLSLNAKTGVLVQQFQSLGELKHLEELAVNMPPGGNNDWAFIHKMPALKKLTIWHGHKFSQLTPFSDLPLESLVLGGCMGLRDLNKGNLARQRDAVLGLKGLPELKRLSLYHSPLTPDDAHLAHIAREFPKLVDLRVDFNAPRGSKIKITPAGLKNLHSLSLKVLTIENAQFFTAEHMRMIATIPTLEKLSINAQKKAMPGILVSAARSARPDLEMTVKLPHKKIETRRIKKTSSKLTDE
jgi:hypothetical protein